MEEEATGSTESQWDIGALLHAVSGVSAIVLGGLMYSKAWAQGLGFGEYGEGYVRFGLIENEHRTRQALRGIKKVLRAGLPSDWEAE